MKENCAQILELLKTGYLDNELDEVTRKQVNQHLEECPACRRMKENLEAVALLLRNAPRANPPENIWPRIQAEIRRARVKPTGNFAALHFKHFFIKRNAFAFAAAAALVLAAVGFNFMTGRTDNGEIAPALASLLGNDEIHAPNLNFGSDLEKHFL